jgi:hypothetical protein
MWDVQQLFRRYNGDLKRYSRRRGACRDGCGPHAGNFSPAADGIAD